MVTLSCGLVISALIVTSAFLYVRYGDALSQISVLQNRIEILEGEVDFLKVRDEFRSSLLTNSTIRAAIQWVELDEHPQGATLGRSEAIRLAREAAQKEGRDLSDYKEPKATYDRRAKENAWWVFFEGKEPTYGNHFSVSVQDPSGTTKLAAGL
jgi:hypothetical protein